MLMEFGTETFSDVPALPFDPADYFRALRSVGANPRCDGKTFTMDYPIKEWERHEALLMDASRLDPDQAERRDYILKCWNARPDGADEVLLGV